VYYQDFPLSKKSSISSPFQTDLISTMQQMLSPPDIIEKIRKYDFSKALGKLILSKPGSFSQTESQKFGLEALATAVKDLQIPKTSKSYSYCQSSSLGSLNQKWLNEFQSCVNGVNYNQLVPESEIKLVFPSDKTVRDSVLGPSNGGTIFAQRKLWNKPEFTKNAVADCNSTSSRALMHSKVIIHLNCKPKGEYLHFTSREDASKEGYIYLGSHNHTQAAWGKYQIRNPILSISNWELGLVIPVKLASRGFKIPFQIPPIPYSASDLPWFNQVDFGAINRLKASFKK
jgi:tyrosyl-DNA phosphodiesterase 1